MLVWTLLHVAEQLLVQTEMFNVVFQFNYCVCIDMWLFNTICVFISHLPSQQKRFYSTTQQSFQPDYHLIIAAVWGHVELTATFPVDRRGVNPKMMDHDPSYEVWSRNHGRISIHWISQTVSSQILCHKLLVKLDLRWICSPCFYEYMSAVCRALLFTQWISGLSQAQMPYPYLCQEWFWQLFRGILQPHGLFGAWPFRPPNADSCRCSPHHPFPFRSMVARSGVLHAKRCSSWRRPPRHKRRSSGNARRRLKGWQRGPQVFEKRITFWNKTGSLYFNPCKYMVILRVFPWNSAL